MNTITLDKSFRKAPALFVSGSFVVSIAVVLLSIISVILSVIVIAPPGSA